MQRTKLIVIIDPDTCDKLSHYHNSVMIQCGAGTGVRTILPTAESNTVSVRLSPIKNQACGYLLRIRRVRTGKVEICLAAQGFSQIRHSESAWSGWTANAPPSGQPTLPGYLSPFFLPVLFLTGFLLLVFFILPFSAFALFFLLQIQGGQNNPYQIGHHQQ